MRCCPIGSCNPRSKLHPEILAKYQQLKKRRGYKKARIAIARRLLTAIYHILLKHVPYTPYIAPAKDTVPAIRILSPEQAIAMLRRKGFFVLEPVAAQQ